MYSFKKNISLLLPLKVKDIEDEKEIERAFQGKTFPRKITQEEIICLAKLIKGISISGIEQKEYQLIRKSLNRMSNRFLLDNIDSIIGLINEEENLKNEIISNANFGDNNIVEVVASIYKRNFSNIGRTVREMVYSGKTREDFFDVDANRFDDTKKMVESETIYKDALVEKAEMEFSGIRGYRYIDEVIDYVEEHTVEYMINDFDNCNKSINMSNACKTDNKLIALLAEQRDKQILKNRDLSMRGMK